MSYRKTTLRKMAPVTRRYARLLGELDSVIRKGKNLLEEISRLEFDSQALANARQHSIETVHEPLFQEGGEKCDLRRLNNS